MELRQALIEQSPSLALQRAAADEIARLDALVAEFKRSISVGFRLTALGPTHIDIITPEGGMEFLQR